MPGDLSGYVTPRHDSRVWRGGGGGGGGGGGWRAVPAMPHRAGAGGGVGGREGGRVVGVLWLRTAKLCAEASPATDHCEDLL